jgi:hypothetical protein
MSTEETRSPMIEFIEDGLGFELTPWQREMALRMERQIMAQAEEAQRIEEQSERQDEANIAALRRPRFHGKQDKDGNFQFTLTRLPDTPMTRRRLPDGGTRTHITTADREWIIDEPGDQSA